jgi:hypothetical protein
VQSYLFSILSFYLFAASKVNSLHLKYFIVSGRIIALALKKKVHVGIVFDRVFFKQLAGNYIITLEDIRDADPIMYSSCKQILEMDADYIDSDALGLTFSTEVEELGHRELIELCPGGESLVVDSKNREKYVHLLIQNRFVTSISKQVSHFAQGFADILSCSRLEFFQFLDLEDFDWMLHGSENAISVEDWKAHTKYHGYKENDHQISWLWKVCRIMILWNHIGFTFTDFYFPPFSCTLKFFGEFKFIIFIFIFHDEIMCFVSHKPLLKLCAW